MWIRPAAAQRFRPRQSQRTTRQARFPSSPTPCASRGAVFLTTRELVDDLRPSMRASAASDDDNAAALHLPFHSLSLTYMMHPSLRTLATSHATLFASLAETPDVLQHLMVHNPCSGHLAAAQLRCVRSAFEAVAPFRDDVQLLLALPSQQRHLVDEVRLVQLIASPSPNASVVVARELKNTRGTSLSSSSPAGGDSVLLTLLSVPCSPDVLRVVLLAALGTTASVNRSAQLFQRVVHALLSNDNFFSERTFPAMHCLLVDVVLPAFEAPGSGPTTTTTTLDPIAVQWTSLMNKWARVYTKGRAGFLLHDCLTAILRVAPAAEAKMPSSFYVRLLGALLDATAAKGCRDVQHGWMLMTSVAGAALRLFGRNAADLRATWVVLLKGALTLPPLRQDHRRVLEAYHLCMQAGHSAPLDRQGFLQVVRLVAAAVGALSTAEVGSVVHDFSVFLQEQASASFLWLLDGVGTLLTDLWNAHGAAVTGEAQELLTTLERLLRERRVSGVDMYANPVIARALQHFELGGAVLFWWRCGCGEELPCTARRCASCLRTSGASWKCTACGRARKQPCGDTPCDCGAPNPRHAAAEGAGVALCPRCGEVKDDMGVCAPCAQQPEAQTRPVVCGHCHESYRANALHCTHCYAANPHKPPLYLWHCGDCDDFNYSIWSACRTCKAPRRSSAVSLPFVPWTCGCGALNHPGRLTCSHCGTGARHHSYTCPGCVAPVSIKSLRRVSVTVGAKAIPLHQCPHCQAIHPCSDLLLYSPSLPRHCMFCAKVIPAAAVGPDTGFHHCGAVQGVNENYVFRCPRCTGGAAAQELQTGYHCRHCLFPRPEVEALMTAANGDPTAPPVTSVWRCLHERAQEGGEEEEEGLGLCGQWNYGWSAHCVACGNGRPDSAYECRARARLWQCETCGSTNRPIDVLFCPQCKNGLQPMQPCSTCGVPHLSYACRVRLQQYR